MDARQEAPSLIAAAFLAGPLNETALTRVATVLIATSARAVEGLVQRLLTRFASERPRRFRVERFIREDSSFQKLSANENFAVRLGAQWPRTMQPAPGVPSGWRVLPIATIGELAELLSLSPGELFWFADPRGLERKTPAGRLRHYHYHWIKKRDGSARLVEAPKTRLKMIQRFLLKHVIAPITPHEAAHGFRVGRSILTFAAPHVGQQIVLKLDLKDFFPSLTRARLLPIFLTAGYPEPVAELLTGLCTNSTPAEILRQCPAGLSYAGRAACAQPHLPQGAPSSPALANLCAFRLDCRLAGFARAASGQYSRYADDLVFSGSREFARGARRFYIAACRIALEEGFEVNTRKTRMMRRSVAQRAAGLVLNEKTNIVRREYDRLKAILHNCTQTGPGAQNRDAHPEFARHLAGRIPHVEMINAGRARKLRELFERIDWGKDE